MKRTSGLSCRSKFQSSNRSIVSFRQNLLSTGRVSLGNKNSYCPAANYLFKVNNGSTSTMCEVSSKLTIKTPERPCQPLTAFTKGPILDILDFRFSLRYLRFSLDTQKIAPRKTAPVP